MCNHPDTAKCPRCRSTCTEMTTIRSVVLAHIEFFECHTCGHLFMVPKPDPQR